MPILRRGPDWSMQWPAVYEAVNALPTFFNWHWSASRMIGGVTGILQAERKLTPRYTGGSGHKRLSGISKDSTGAPLPGATVWAYRKDDDVANSRYRYAQEGTVGISAADGAYEVMVPTGDQYGIVSYKDGATPVAGTTLNTLVGT